MQLVVKSKPDAATSQSQMQLQVKDNLANWLNFNVLNLCLISKKQSVAYGHQFSLFHKLQTLTHFAFSANLAVLSENVEFSANLAVLSEKFAFWASLAVPSENFAFWASFGWSHSRSTLLSRFRAVALLLAEVSFVESQKIHLRTKLSRPIRTLVRNWIWWSRSG